MREGRIGVFCCIVVAAASLNSIPASAQETGTLTGTVTAGDTNKPLDRVRVRVLGTTLETESLEDGRFRITGIPAGRYDVELRLLGYAVKIQKIDLASGATLLVPVTLVSATVSLDTVSVTATLIPPHLRGFEERRQRGQGRFFTRSQIDKMHARSVTDILRRVPGFQFQAAKMDGSSVQTGRTGVRVCPVMYYINGSPFPVTADQSINSFLDSDAVEGIEVYSGSSSIPSQFNSTMYSSRCGVIVIWTRIGIDRSVK